jgi:hypothetical protein
MTASCTDTHRFHDALVDSDLVSGPIKKYSRQYCSTVSIQTAIGRHAIQLSFHALLVGTTVSCSQLDCQHSCPSEARSCASLCSTGVVVALSPAVVFWNKVFPVVRLSPAAVSASGCTEMTIFPRIRWEMLSNGVLLSLNCSETLKGMQLL